VKGRKSDAIAVFYTEIYRDLVIIYICDVRSYQMEIESFTEIICSNYTTIRSQSVSNSNSNQFYARPCTMYCLFTMQYSFSYNQATKLKNI